MRFYLLLIMTVLTLGVFAQQKGYVIKGRFENAAGIKVFLEHFFEEKRYVDSAVADKSGRFLFKGVVLEPQPFYLSFKGNAGAYNFFVENCAYKLNGDAKRLDATIVEGGEEQALYNKYQELIDQLNASMANMQKPAMYMLKQKDTTSFIALVNASNILWSDSMSAVQAKFIIEHPSSGVAVHAMKYLISKVKSVGRLDSLMQLIEATSASRYPSAKKIRDLISSRTKLTIGAEAPDFKQPDTVGKMVSLSDLRGKYVLVDFWASWCAPCRAENPNVLKAYNKFKDKNFTVLAVSIDVVRSSWLKSIRDDGLPWLQLSDLKANNDAARIYAVTSVPTNYLVDPSGKIIAENLRGEALEEALKQNLDK